MRYVTIQADMTAPQINFTSPTPPNGTTTSNTSIEINVSIIESALDEVKFNWNGTNYTMYNDSLVLMMNFDNVSALGENNTHVVDVSSGGNNGTVVGGNFTTPDGKYGRAMMFDGSGDYISIPTTPALPSAFTISVWVNPDSTTDDEYISEFSGGNEFALIKGYQDGFYNVYGGLGRHQNCFGDCKFCIFPALAGYCHRLI